MNNLKKLPVLRKKIDSLDKRILRLFRKRMIIVKEIGKVKQDNHLLPFDKKRKDAVIRLRLKEAKLLGLSSDFVKKVFKLISSYSLELQKTKNR